MTSSAIVKKTSTIIHFFLEEPAALNASEDLDAASAIAQIEMASAPSAITKRSVYAAKPATSKDYV